MSEPGRDESLMAEAAKGQRGPLETLIRRHATPLLTFLVRMSGSYHRGEELFQEAFLAVWRKRSQYEYPRSFKTWLYAIAVNQCRAAFLRVQPSLVPFTEDATPVPAGVADSPVETAIDGLYPYLLAVRDLASGQQLLWLPQTEA